jgi:hypothetical protein
MEFPRQWGIGSNNDKAVLRGTPKFRRVRSDGAAIEMGPVHKMVERAVVAAMLGGLASAISELIHPLHHVGHMEAADTVLAGPDDNEKKRHD